MVCHFLLVMLMAKVSLIMELVALTVFNLLRVWLEEDAVDLEECVVALEWLRIEQQDGPLELHVLLPGAVYTPLIAKALPDAALAPAELELISAERCAQVALQGIDHGLFYIPTQAHLLEDMQPRMDEITQALAVLEIEKTF